MPTGQADRLMPTLRRVVLARQSAARSDGELLGAFVAARDADAFAELVRRHGPMVLGVCRRVVGDRATAEDAFQASFIVLARRASAVRPREQVGNWLYGVAYRTALKARTVLARRRSREKQVDVMPEPTAPAARTDWTDLLPVIDEELAKLPDKLRVPVVLCDLEGRPQREVARHLNVPPATLATRLAAARRTLAQRLTRRGVTLSGGALAGLLGLHAAAHAVPPTLVGGAVRAGEAVAAGGALDSLVSAHAVQLSEGVMRMMMLAKLKAVAVLAVTALALTTGLGLGLVPATAGEDSSPAPGAKVAANPAPAAPQPAVNHPAARPKDRGQPEPEADDATFLRRLCLDVRGTPPTPVEMWFFVSDEDADKRAKVVEWMTDDDAARLFLAKKLGVPPDRIRVLRGKVSADGAVVEVKVAAAGDSVHRPVAIAFTPDNNLVAEYAIRQDPAALIARLDATHAIDRTVLRAWVADTPDRKTEVTWKKARLATDKAAKTPDDQTDLFLKVWDFAAEDKNASGTFLFLNEGNYDLVLTTDSDAEFLKRVLTDVRGSGPTTLELKYFTEDKDAKKREKLIDTLLKDPAVQKKLGDEWKKKMLAPPPVSFNRGVNDRWFIYSPRLATPQVDTLRGLLPYIESQSPTPPTPPTPPVPPTPPAPQVDKFDKLVGELIAAKKSDEAILEAITLATLSRLPTDSEKKITLASIGKAADRKAAWVAVAKALAGTQAKEVDVIKGKIHVEVKPPAPPKPPVPPAKP